MLGSNKRGFTLLEILVVLAIIGIMATIIVPNLKNLLPRREREAFVGKLNALTRYAWQHALIERKVHKISVNFEKKLMWVEMATDVLKDGKPEFARIKGAYLNTSIVIPSSIQIKNFIIEGYDEMSRYGPGSKLQESWFFIMPDGLTQTVTINLLDTRQTNVAGKPRQFGLVLNPFNAQFKVYESFQK